MSWRTPKLYVNAVGDRLAEASLDKSEDKGPSS